jgi:hypothetical protein
MILSFVAMVEYWKHACILFLTQIAVPSPIAWVFNCRIAEIKAQNSVGARKKKAKKEDETRKQSAQARHEVAGLSLLREVSTFDVAGKALLLAGLVVLALEVAGCVWLEPYVKTGLVDWRVSSTAPPPAPIQMQDSGCLLVLLVLKAVDVWGVAFVVQQHQNRRPERERACGAAADTTVCVEPGKAAGGGAADSRSYLTAATLAVLVAASQVSSAQAYGCTNDTHCQYSPCSTYACSSSSSNCVNGKWRAYCGYNLDIEVGRYWGCYRWSSGYPPPWCGDPQACPAGQYSIGGGKNGGADYACRSCDAGKYASTAGTYVRLSTKLKAHPRELNLHVWKMPVTENISDISE